MQIYDNKGTLVLDIEVDDTSVRYKAIKGENSLTLKFSLAEHVEVPIGSYCVFKGETYSLMLPEDLTLNHRRSFEYTLVMHSDDARAKRYKFINPVDRRLKFSLTAKPVEHLQMFVDNMNMRDNGWSVGECPDHVEIVLSYNHTFCHDALVQLAEELEVDYWFDGKTVNLGKLELNKDNPLPLSYGGDGEGLKPNIKRTNYADVLPIEVLYIQGGTTNIDASKYGSSELHLPKSRTIGFDGEHFDDETGFDHSKARGYKTDENGFYVVRVDKRIANHSEDSLDCSDIQPTKKETVHSVIPVDREKHFYDILFKSDVDYSKYVIGGENAYVVFQSGMLAGKEFDLATNEDGELICKKEGDYWRVEIVPQDIDGITMPDEDTGYMPVNGNEFKVFGVQLPDEYVADAELEMLKYAVKHFYANEDVQYTIAGELDEIFAKRNWGAISDRLSLGNYVSFSDKSFQEEPLLIRIIGIKEYVNKPYSPILEISNAAIAGTLAGTLNRIENDEVKVEDKFNEAKRYTKRSFAKMKETMSMIEAAVDGFSPGIDPVILQTMAIGVGKESLQFAFVKSLLSDEEITPNFVFDELTSVFSVPASVLMHYTIDVNAISSSFDKGAYRRWSIDPYDSAPMYEGEKAYYLYAMVLKSGDTGEYVLTQDPMPFDDGEYYNLLVGVLNTEFNGFRTFVPLYGFTEILPGQITTDIIRSADGSCVFDLRGNTITGAVKFLPGTSGLENVEGLSEAVQGAVGGLEFGKYNLLRNSGFTGDFVTESLGGNTVLDENQQLFSDPFRHWRHINASVTDSDVSESGKMCTLIDNGVLTQELETKIIKGESYVVSFRARGMNLTFAIGGVTKTIELNEEWGRYVEKFTALSDSSVFAISNAKCDICEIQLERGNVVSAWGYSMWDNESSIAKYQSMQYLEAALAKGGTDVLGGLIFSNLLLLGNPSKSDNTAGVSGIYEDDTDVSFWAGGSYEQAIATVAKYVEDPTYQPTDEDVALMAKAVITHGGRAILNDVILRGTIYAKSGSFGDFAIDGLFAKSSHTESHGCKWGDGMYNAWWDNREAEINAAGFKDIEYHGTTSISVGFSTNIGYYSNPEESGEKFSFYAESGMIGGMRPAMRVVMETGSNAYPNIVYNADHTIIAWTMDTAYLKLPTEPKDGQEIVIMNPMSAPLVVYGTTARTIFDVGKGTDNWQWTFDGSKVVKATLIYSAELTMWILKTE